MAFTLNDITNSYDLSGNCTLSIGGEKLGGLKNFDVNFSADSGADNSTRSDGAWKVEAPGRGGFQINVTFNKLETDACQVGLRGWAVNPDRLTKTATIIYRSEDEDTSAGTGFKGEFFLTSLVETNSDDVGQAVECTASFTSFGAIVADNATSSGSGGSGGSGGDVT